MRARRHCQTPKPGRQRCRRPGPPHADPGQARSGLPGRPWREWLAVWIYVYPRSAE